MKFSLAILIFAAIAAAAYSAPVKDELRESVADNVAESSNVADIVEDANSRVKRSPGGHHKGKGKQSSSEEAPQGRTLYDVNPVIAHPAYGVAAAPYGYGAAYPAPHLSYGVPTYGAPSPYGYPGGVVVG